MRNVNFKWDATILGFNDLQKEASLSEKQYLFTSCVKTLLKIII